MTIEPVRGRDILRIIGMFHLACIGWLLFRARSMAQVVEMFAGLLHWETPGLAGLSHAVGLILLAELVLIFGSWIGAPDGSQTRPMAPASEMTNTEALGRILYTDYVYLFQASGMVLLVAMIGAIVLTLRTRPGVRKQVIAKQLARTREQSMAIIKVKSGEGA